MAVGVFLSRTEAPRGWRAEIEMFAPRKVLFCSLPHRPELLRFNPLAPAPSPFKVPGLASVKEPTPLTHGKAQHPASCDPADKQPKGFITKDTLSARLLLAEQTPAAAADSSAPLPAATGLPHGQTAQTCPARSELCRAERTEPFLPGLTESLTQQRCQVCPNSSISTRISRRGPGERGELAAGKGQDALLQLTAAPQVSWQPGVN